MAKGKCYLANTIDTLGTQHTSENLVQIVKEQIEHCESTYKVNITSLVCDNAANMVSMRKQLADDIGLHVFGCNAHYANLLAKDICNSSGGKSVLAKITDIIKYLRNTHSAMSMLRNKNMNRPKMPVETRWNSQCEIVDYFLANWMNIVCIISELLPKNDKLFRYMEDIQLKRGAMDLQEALKPIARALDVLQADKTTIAEAVDVWKTLLQKCPGAFKEHVVKRMNDALSPPVLAAYLLDHRFQGKVLTPTETQEALDYIKLMNADAMPHVMQFLAQEPPFSKHLFDSELAKAAPVSWWKTGVRLGFPESIVNLAVAIVGGASSSGGLERHFPSLGFSYGTLRAQLGIEKAGKLAFLYRELNQ